MLRRAVGRLSAAIGKIVAWSSGVRLPGVGPAQRGRLGRTRVHRSNRTRATTASAGRGVGRVLVVLRLVARLIRLLVGGAGRQHRRSGRTSAQAGALRSRQGGARRSMPSGAPWRRVGQQARGIAASLTPMSPRQGGRSHRTRVVPDLKTGLRLVQTLHHLRRDLVDLIFFAFRLEVIIISQFDFN